MKKILTIFSLTLIALFGAIVTVSSAYANQIYLATVIDIDNNVYTLTQGQEYILTTDRPGGWNEYPNIDERYVGLWNAHQFDSPQNDYGSLIGYSDEGHTVRNVIFSNSIGGSILISVPNKDYYVRSGSNSLTVSDGTTIVLTIASKRLYIKSFDYEDDRPVIDDHELVDKSNNPWFFGGAIIVGLILIIGLFININSKPNYKKRKRVTKK